MRARDDLPISICYMFVVSAATFNTICYLPMYVPYDDVVPVP